MKRMTRIKTPAIVYKVIKDARCNFLFSAIQTGKFQILYEVEKPAYPTIGKIFVFETHADAVTFITINNWGLCTVKIYKAKIVGRAYKALLMTTSGDIEHFWKRSNADHNTYTYPVPPSGTLFADCIVLKEDVTFECTRNAG